MVDKSGNLQRQLVDKTAELQRSENELRELQQRLAENAEIVEVYDKLHQHNVVGGHWMWGMVAQAAESGDAEQAARDHGLVRGQGWLPIESAPKDGTPILGYRKPRLRAAIVGTAYVVPRDDGECWYFAGTCAHVDIAPEVKPTHWMPLPAAPQASEVNEGAASLNSGAAMDD